MKTLKIKPIFILTFILTLALTGTACEGPAGPQGPRGEEGSQGEQGSAGEDGQDGEDGNGNVTLYVFDGHDFGTQSIWGGDCIDVTDRTEWEESHWSAFLTRTNTGVESMFPVAAIDNALFVTIFDYFNDTTSPKIDCEDQVAPVIYDFGGIRGGSTVSAIHVLQIRASNVVEANLTAGQRPSPESVIPADLDLTDYNAIVEYYGLTEDDIMRM